MRLHDSDAGRRCGPQVDAGLVIGFEPMLAHFARAKRTRPKAVPARRHGKAYGIGVVVRAAQDDEPSGLALEVGFDDGVRIDWGLEWLRRDRHSDRYPHVAGCADPNHAVAHRKSAACRLLSPGVRQVAARAIVRDVHWEVIGEQRQLVPLRHQRQSTATEH